ncbi:hypothetical protein [Nocardia gipuzkoensis]
MDGALPQIIRGMGISGIRNAYLNSWIENAPRRLVRLHISARHPGR